jgi:predicted membrane channel-forming protein YqfA (hemolysin III family)
MLKISHPLMHILAIVLSILLIPFVAMQFTTEVNWSIFDFLVAGILLFVAGIAFYLIIKNNSP